MIHQTQSDRTGYLYSSVSPGGKEKRGGRRGGREGEERGKRGGREGEGEGE